jgi:BirA family transcriptional regulator, biotin operon repressor / biotin---[acetyl-CoA-carboxylase] ligase
LSTSHNTISVGKVFFHFSELVSTNEHANNLLSKSNPIEGTVISADFQTKGRGQVGSKWESESGQNVLMSVINYPQFLELQAAFYLNKVVSLAVLDLLKPFVEGVSIKWPNDIYIGSRKVAGILIQNAVQSGKIQHSIVGIGLNINQLKFSEGLPKATALAIATGRSYDLSDIRTQLWKHLSNRLTQLKNLQFAELDRAYLQSLYQVDEKKPYQRKDGALFEGIIKNVLPNGHLVVTVEGREELFDIKEITFL